MNAGILCLHISICVWPVVLRLPPGRRHACQPNLTCASFTMDRVYRSIRDQLSRTAWPPNRHDAGTTKFVVFDMLEFKRHLRARAARSAAEQTSFSHACVVELLPCGCLSLRSTIQHLGGTTLAKQLKRPGWRVADAASHHWPAFLLRTISLISQ